MTVSAASFPPGTELADGKYRIVAFLGAGGMGAVFEAEHTLTAKRVAIKCVQVGRDPGDPAGLRLVREARFAARIRHPNVVDVYDVIRWPGYLGLVMELLSGEPLSELLKRGPLSVERALSLLVPAMRGVAAAHRVGVIHRDIKPANIFLAAEADANAPVPKLLDFGIAKQGWRDLELSTLTRSGQFLGTPLYMSLEQFKSDGDIDARADVFSLGVVVYQALTGRLPFESDTVPGLIVKLTTTEPEAPSALCSAIPRGLSDAILCAIARERDDRIDSVDALITALEAGAQTAASGEQAARLRAEVAEIRHEPESMRPRVAVSHISLAPERAGHVVWATGLLAACALGGGLYAVRAQHAARETAVSSARANVAAIDGVVVEEKPASVPPPATPAADGGALVGVLPSAAPVAPAPQRPAIDSAAASRRAPETESSVKPREASAGARRRAGALTHPRPPLSAEPRAPARAVPTEDRDERIEKPPSAQAEALEPKAATLRFEAPTSEEF